MCTSRWMLPCARLKAVSSAAFPAIVSLHSINFHSTVGDIRGRTIRILDQFLTALESKHADLLYLHDEDLYKLVTKGFCPTANGTLQANVTTKKFRRRERRDSTRHD